MNGTLGLQRSHRGFGEECVNEIRLHVPDGQVCINDAGEHIHHLIIGKI